jgi:HEAT repeat protein
MDSRGRERSASSAASYEITMKPEIESLLEELTSGDDDQAERAAASLKKFGNEVLPAIQKLLISTDVDIRWWAVRALAEMDPPSLDLLIGSMEDESQEVRQCAALAICHHPTARAIPALLKLLQESESVTSNLAATALIATGKEATAKLLELLPVVKDTARIEAYRALACIEDQQSIPALMAGLEEDSLMINYWAEEGLNRLGLGMVYMKPD